MNKLRSKMLGDNKAQHMPDELITVSKIEIDTKIEKAAKEIAQSNTIIIPPIGINLKVPHEIDVLLVNEKMFRKGQGIKISKEELVLEAIKQYYK